MSNKRNARIPTQKELAKRLGVSQMTISRALNNQPGVGPELKRKILKEINRYDYTPNSIARVLVGKRSQVIGLVIPDIASSFFPEITKRIETELNKKGYKVIIAHTQESYPKEAGEIETLISLRVEGFIIAPAGGENEVDIYHKLTRLNIPFVFIDRFKKTVRCSCVITDTKEGAKILGGYLREKGYRRWGYLQGPKGISTSEEHYLGLVESVKEGKSSSEVVITPVRAGFSEEEGYRAAQELLARTEPEVIIGVNDPVAIGALRCLKEKGIKVPQEIAIAGFSDVKLVDLIVPPLTTVREFPETIGKTAVELLLQEIESKYSEKVCRRIRPELVVRESA